MSRHYSPKEFDKKFKPGDLFLLENSTLVGVCNFEKWKLGANSKYAFELKSDEKYVLMFLGTKEKEIPPTQQMQNAMAGRWYNFFLVRENTNFSIYDFELKGFVKINQ